MPQNAGISEPIAASTLELLSLPDPSIKAIMAQIPLQQLITTIPLVHPRLSAFRETALLTNRHLELFIGNQQGIHRNIVCCPFRLPFSRYLVDSRGQPLYPETTFHRLRLATLNSETVDQLTRLMPAISHLTIRLSQVDILTILEIIRLLISWSSTLTSFTFSCEFTNPTGRDSRPDWERKRDKAVFGYMLLRLIDSINSHLASLEILSLQMREALFGPPVEHWAFPGRDVYGEPTLWMPILGRLKEFYFSTGDLYEEFIINTLRDCATPDGACSLQAIAIAMANHWEVYLNAFPAGSTLASRFVSLPYISPSKTLNRAVLLADLWNRQNPDNIEFFEKIIEEEGLREIICASPSPVEKYMQLQERLLGAYSNLRVVTVEVDATRPLHAVLGPLSRLKQLQVLKLKIDDPLRLGGEPLPSDYPSLPSVLALCFYLHSDYENARHTDLNSPLWASHFPSVQMVMLEHISILQFCTICYPKVNAAFIERLGDTRYKVAIPCLKQLIAPLTVLPSLRQLFYKRNTAPKNTLEFSPSGEFIQAHKEDIY